MAPRASAKLRSGLGLVPAPGGGAWRYLGATLHRCGDRGADREGSSPYHHALAERLTAVRARFGVAVLLDLHSMPPLGHRGWCRASSSATDMARPAATRFVRRIERRHAVLVSP